MALVQLPSGNYVQIYLLDSGLDLDMSMVTELIIITDWNRFLPTLTMKYQDKGGKLSHFLTRDVAARLQVYFTLSPDVSTSANNKSNPGNQYIFNVFRQSPSGNKLDMNEIEIVGVLDIKNIFVPDYSRSWRDTPINVLSQIATGDLGIKTENVDIDDSLDQEVLMIQGMQPNAAFLSSLTNNLEGNDDRSGWKCFIKNEAMEPYFVFKSVKTLIDRTDCDYVLVVSDQDSVMQDNSVQVYNYEGVENAGLSGIVAGSEQTRYWFDFPSGTLKHESDPVTEYLSLTQYFSMPTGSLGSPHVEMTGRSNEITDDFIGRSRARYWDKLTDTFKLWIQMRGVPNINPGDSVFLYFGDSFVYQNPSAIKTNGFYLVERVIHQLHRPYQCRVLLTRNGFDSSISKGLITATNKRILKLI